MTLLQTDLCVLGAGPGGYVAALRAAQLGLKVTVVEEHALGGVCLNRGCIPTKAMLQAAALAQEIRRAEEFGILAGEPGIDYQALVKRREKVVSRLRTGVQSLLKAADVQVVYGRGRLIGPQTVEVALAAGGKGGLALDAGSGETEQIRANHIIVATGSRPVSLDFPGAEHPRVLDSDSVLRLDRAPGRLAVLGAGPAGTQFTTIFKRLGSEVTLLEREPSILPLKEPETAKVLASSLRKEGVAIKTGSTVTSLAETPAGSLLLELSGEGRSSLEVDFLLVTVGRVPLTEGLGLEQAGLRLDDLGALPVDGLGRSAVPSVLAIGDVTGVAFLADAAIRQGVAAAETLAGLNPDPLRVDRLPQVVFTDPEVVSVGLTEAEARAQGLPVTVGLFPLAANGRALIYGAEAGLVKVVSEERFGRVLGVHMAGSHLGELTAEAVLALELEATVDELSSVVRTHPSLSEALGEAALAVGGQALHIPKKAR